LEQLKITVHPLFLAVGILSALFGGLPVFVICVLTALLHECGHVFFAARRGFECKKISLMPYGAAAVCDIEGISLSDEIKLALSGPLVNLALITAVAGLWWFYPITYAYTDTLFYANAGMLAINLLPAYPLDGGRVLKCFLIKFLKPKTVNIALRAVALIIAVSLAAVFIWVRNISIITIALFLAVSAFGKSVPAQKIDFTRRKKKRGREIKYVILDENATYAEALRHADGRRYLVLQIYGEQFLDEITEDELYERLMEHGVYEKIL